MLQKLLGKVGSTAMKAFGVVKPALRTLGQIGLSAGKFAIQNHQHIAPLLHGVAMASGNQTAQKITGGLLSLSQMATMRQKLNEGNARIQQAMANNGGRAGVYDHQKGVLT